MTNVKEDVSGVKTDLKDLKTNTEQGFKDLNEKMDAFIAKADETFVTVVQAKVVGWLLAFLLSVGTFVYLIIDHVKK